jgi:uncharacterized protein (TIGR00290 family)
MAEKILFAWSSGKDSAMALYTLLKDPRHEIAALLTTVTRGYDRVSMHGVRRDLLERQADALGLPLVKVFITRRSTNEEYESKMRDALEQYRAQGVTSVAFGDIFLEDLKKYREDKLAQLGMTALFPIWRKNSLELANAFIDTGFKAVVTCVDSRHLPKDFAGRKFDRAFLSELPSHVDPCGENGEFHSFAYDGPIFRDEIPVSAGEVVLRDKFFYFCDLTAA